jgi:hypothetical protein
MIESVLVIILTCLCFLGIFQYANLFASKAVLSHAAARAARARAVGFNYWMVEKSAFAAAIPASGKRLTPASAGIDAALSSLIGHFRNNEWTEGLEKSFYSFTNALTASTLMERGRIPDYMDSVNRPTAENILNYELWEALSVNLDEPINLDGATPGFLTATVRQRHPLLVAFASLAEGELSNDPGGNISLEGSFSIESHYPLYLEDMNW